MGNKYKALSSRQKQERNCAQKVTYNTSAHAAVMALRYGQTMYQCPVCGKFHLTSQKAPSAEQTAFHFQQPLASDNG